MIYIMDQKKLNKTMKLDKETLNSFFFYIFYKKILTKMRTCVYNKYTNKCSEAKYENKKYK